MHQCGSSGHRPEAACSSPAIDGPWQLVNVPPSLPIGEQKGHDWSAQQTYRIANSIAEVVRAGDDCVGVDRIIPMVEKRSVFVVRPEKYTVRLCGTTSQRFLIVGSKPSQQV
jgi:hypothetical protein